MPAAPGTTAWPPSLPSVPTSRATRVTSEVNALICSIIAFTMVAERRNSPFSGRPSTSSAMACDRSPFTDARDGSRDFGVRPEQVVDERVDGDFHRAPCARAQLVRHAMPRLAVFADDLARAIELLRHALARAGDLVERIRYLAGHAGEIARQSHGEIAVAHGLQAAQQLAHVDVGIGRSAAPVTVAAANEAALCVRLGHASSCDARALEHPSENSGMGACGESGRSGGSGKISNAAEDTALPPKGGGQPGAQRFVGAAECLVHFDHGETPGPVGQASWRLRATKGKPRKNHSFIDQRGEGIRCRSRSKGNLRLERRCLPTVSGPRFRLPDPPHLP